jgi:gliding motility associated protien GldN
MKKIVLLLFVVTISVVSIKPVTAQVVDGAYKKAITNDRKPAPLTSVREADVLWSRTIWRMIDLREKMNQPLYYPTTEMQGRMSLTLVMLKGIKDGQITAYDAGGDNEFKLPMTFDEVKEAFGATTKVVKRRNFDTGEMEDQVIEQDIISKEVKNIMVKEVWYFDKQTSTMEVRILGLCPIREYYGDEDVNQEDIRKAKVFWVYYPEVRNLLAKYEVLNPFNDARSISFDDFFVTRRFDSYIVRESNIYNNRLIKQYATGDYLKSEAERIKRMMFDFEQNLWEY